MGGNQGKNVNYFLGLFSSANTDDVTVFDNLNLNIEKAYDLSKNKIILGDLNKDLFNDNFQNFRDLILLNSLRNTINVITRQLALLDPIIIVGDMQFLDVETISTPPNISDHKATYIKSFITFVSQRPKD